MSPALTPAVGRGLAGEDRLQAVLRINSPTRLWSIASLPSPCTNLFLQHLGSIVSAKFAQHSAFFIPADFLFLLAHFSLALILYFFVFFFFPAGRGCCSPRNCVGLPRNGEPGRSGRAGDAPCGSELAVSWAPQCAPRARDVGLCRGGTTRSPAKLP